MPNQNRTTPGTGPSNRQPPPPAPDEDKGEQDVRDLSSQRQREHQPIDGDVEKPDSVEIGDPIPEDDRTIRAQVETGEDEDLPSEDGSRHLGASQKGIDRI